jgi:hypothetical protein
MQLFFQLPNFGQLMALVGATCCNLLAFIMPALCHLALFRSLFTFTRSLYQETQAEGTDWFIEGPAFSLSYELAPRPPPPPTPVTKLSRFLSLPMCC